MGFPGKTGRPENTPELESVLSGTMVEHMAQSPGELCQSLASRCPDFSVSCLKKLYRTMKRIRMFDEALVTLKNQDAIRGPVHLYTGQEAIAAGVCQALKPQDLLGTHHRGHAHLLAKGLDVHSIVSEFHGHTEGLNGGRAGPMHILDPGSGVVGCNGIVGAGVPHVLGGLLSARMDDDDRVGAAFFGDGAINQGVVMESLNLSKILSLPALFVCENNQYAVSTRIEEVTAGESLVDRADAFNLDGFQLNGQNVLEVYGTVKDLVDPIREDPEPQFLECVTYRFEGHFTDEKTMMGDRADYRPSEEKKAWRKLDPLKSFRNALLESESVNSSTLETIDEEERDRIQESVKRTEDGSHPPASDAYNSVYVNQNYDSFPRGKQR